MCKHISTFGLHILENWAEQPKTVMTQRMLSALRRITNRRPLTAHVVAYGLLCGAAVVTQQSVDMKWLSGGKEVRDLLFSINKV